MMRRLLTAAGFIFAAAPAFAQGQYCGARNAIVDELATSYGETKVSGGISAGTLIEVFANRETGSWTILRTHPNGVACGVAAGEDWRPEPDIDVPDGDPA